MQDLSEEILGRARKGDLQAFYELYRCASGFVFSVAMRMTRNAADAEEVTQDVFVKIHKNLKKYEERSSFKTWIYRITMNTALDCCKKRSREGRKKASLEGLAPSGTAEPEAERRLFEEDAERKLGEILGCLNPDQRACILLREIEGLNYRQIADVLQINLNTVRSRLKRAREAMIAYARQGVAQ